MRRSRDETRPDPSRGLGAMGCVRLGSVSTNVLRAARGPVLIYSRSAEESMGRTSQEGAVPRSRRATPSRLPRDGS